MFEKIKLLKPFIKGAIKSKTVNVNIVIIVAAVVGVYLFPALVPLLNNVSLALAAGVNIYLRSVTVEGLVKKGEK